MYKTLTKLYIPLGNRKKCLNLGNASKFDQNINSWSLDTNLVCLGTDKKLQGEAGEHGQEQHHLAAADVGEELRVNSYHVAFT